MIGGYYVIDCKRVDSTAVTIPVNQATIILCDLSVGKAVLCSNVTSNELSFYGTVVSVSEDQATINISKSDATGYSIIIKNTGTITLTANTKEDV